jgi:hypothetical protein
MLADAKGIAARDGRGIYTELNCRSWSQRRARLTYPSNDRQGGERSFAAHRPIYRDTLYGDRQGGGQKKRRLTQSIQSGPSVQEASPCTYNLTEAKKAAVNLKKEGLDGPHTL